jgi:hypothetical protein
MTVSGIKAATFLLIPQCDRVPRKIKGISDKKARNVLVR